MPQRDRILIQAYRSELFPGHVVVIDTDGTRWYCEDLHGGWWLSNRVFNSDLSRNRWEPLEGEANRLMIKKVEELPESGQGA